MKPFFKRFSVYVILVIGFIAVGYDSLSQADENGTIPASTPAPGFEPKAPHGGLLVDAGDDFAHVELVFDSIRGTLSAYILDGEAEEVVPLKQTTILVRLAKPVRTLKLKADISPLSGEKPGATSSYTLTDPSWKGLSQLRGALVSVDFNGRVFKNLAFQFPPEKGIGGFMKFDFKKGLAYGAVTGRSVLFFLSGQYFRTGLSKIICSG